MTTVVITKEFFVSGILNSNGEVFSEKKNYSSIIDGSKKAKVFYEGLGFTSVAMTTCHGIALIKDSNDRLLSFVAPVSHMSKKTCTIKEYNMTYWAWNEVKRQAESVAKKAVVKSSVEVDTEEKNTTIKGSVGVKTLQKKTVYYAIRKGRTVGIFTDWGETFELVNGYSGAEFKKFSVLSDAEEYLKGGDDE